MPNLNLEVGQTWRDKYVIVTIDKIEHAIVYYTQRDVNTNNKDNTVKEDCTLLNFEDWILNRKAKFIQPEKAARKQKEDKANVARK